MTKIIHRNNPSWLITLSMILLLFIGIILSTIQIQNQKTLVTRADNTANCAVDADSLTITAQEQNLLTLINNYRAQHGLNPLTFSNELIRAATWMSSDMLAHKYLNHTDSLGRIFSDRIQACGYTNFLTMGENIDSGDPDSLSTFNAWSHSPPHNAAMLNPDFTEAGISLASDTSSDSYYWTLDLGSRTSATNPTPTTPPTTPTTGTTPTGTSSPSPTTISSPTPTPATVYPALQGFQPNPVIPGQKIKITASGGYSVTWDGGIIEGNRQFQLYLDSQPVSEIQCYVNHCEKEFLLPQLSNGIHTISVEGGSKLTLNITDPVPTKPFTPTATPTPSNTPTPTMPPGFVQNPQDMQIFVLAKIKGIGLDGNRNPKERTRHVTATIYDSKNKEVSSGNGFIIYDGMDAFGGIIHFGPIKNGTYYIKIIADRMLQTTVKPIFQILDSSRLNILPKVTLIQGDINYDNTINISDYNLALSCFQDKKCENKELIDFNNDGIASVIDYNILLQDYWESLGD